MICRSRTSHPSAGSDSESADISTADELLRLGQSWPTVAPETQTGVLDPLCRKIAIAGKVWATYEHDWRKKKNSAPLPDSEWPLLIVVLLAYATPNSESDGASRGIELKNLNAALQAIDIAEARSGISHLDVLREQANELVQELARSRP